MVVSQIATHAPRVVQLESFTPSLLTVHGTLILLTIGGAPWTWLFVGLTALLVMNNPTRWSSTVNCTQLRAILLVINSTIIIAITGGTNSYFLLWYFVIVAIYPIVLQPPIAVALPVSVALLYLLMLPFSQGPVPPVVVGARSLLLFYIGFITQRLGAIFAEYLNDRARLIQQASDGIFVTDLNGNYLEVNQSGCRLLGYTEAEIRQKNMRDLLVPEAQADNHYLDELKAGKAILHEPTMRHKDGRLIAVEINARVISGKKLLASVRDRTERKQAEAQIQRQLHELTTLYESARRLQRLYTPTGLAQELIAIMEQTLAYEFGAILLIDQPTGKLIPFAVSDQGHGTVFVELDKAYILSHGLTIGDGITGWVAQTGESVRLGDVHKDPRYHTMRAEVLSELCVPLRVGDTILGVLNIEATRYDAYTEADQRLLETLAAQIALAVQQTHLQEEIRRHTTELERRVAERTTQLQAANQELEAFAYSVSHDLRAPVRAIEGFSNALREYQAEPFDEQGRHYLERIRQAAQRMGQLIDDLFKLSQFTRGELTYRQVDLSALVRAITVELQMHDPQRQAAFVIADGVIVQGDQDLLRIALQNLLENAWKFSSTRVVAHIEFGTLPPEQWAGVAPAQGAADEAQARPGRRPALVCFVRDNGIGFDMAYADKLFTPFQRLHSPTEFPGTGIGLATVRRILARHGGALWAVAVVDQGATFYFTLER